MIKKENAQRERWDIYAIMCIIISFGGWCFEVVGRFLVYRSVGDRGFLTLPLCPIYGSSILIIYLLIGTLREPRGLGVKLFARSGMGKIKSRIARLVGYFLVATLIPTIAELAVGLPFKLIGMPLWDYSSLPLDLFGVICLYFSLLWGVMITLFMTFVWDRGYRALSKLPVGITQAVSATSLLFIIADFIVTSVYTWG